MRKKILIILIASAMFLFCVVVFVGNRVPDAEIVFEDDLPPTEMSVATPEPSEVIVTQYSQYEASETEATLWALCNKYAPSEEAAAAAMGMFYRESRYKSNALCGWASCFPEFPTLCEDFSATVDAGLADGSSYEYFVATIHDKHGGFGLATWYSRAYLERLYAYAQKWGTSISDAEMQISFLFWDIKENDPELWETLCKAHSAEFAGEQMGIRYDHTSEYDAIGSFARDIYNRQKGITE